MCTRPVPRYIKSRTFGTYRWIDTSCGKCCECLKQRQNSWKLRISEEARNWKYLYFFTLTYREDSLPYNVDEETGEMFSTARKKDVQDWLKRMRERISRLYGSRLQMKYFICAEYGPKPTGTKRPHYHGVILSDVVYHDFYPSFEEWRCEYGRMEFKLVKPKKSGDNYVAANSRVANYVSKYCAKGEFNSRKDDIESGRIERAWILSSKNIGLSYVDRMKDTFLSYVPSLVSVEGDWDIHEFDKIYSFTKDYQFWKDIDNLLDNMKVYNGLDGYGYRMPRYYRERIFQRRKTYYDKVIDKNNELKFKKTTRYVAENFLSVAIAYRQRVIAETRTAEKVQSALRRRGLLKNVYSKKEWLQFSDLCSDLAMEFERDAELSRARRERRSYSQLSRFYESNALKNESLN